MKRKVGETQEDYRKRHSAAAALLREKLRGRVWWDSANLGTYRKKTLQKIGGEDS